MPAPTDTAAFSLWSLATVKNYCNAVATNHDATLIRIADGVSARVEQYIRRPFVSRSVTELRDGSGGQELQLRHFPVISVESAQYRFSLFDVWQTFDPTAYELDGFRGYLILKMFVWPKVRQGAQVQYTVGFGAKDDATTLSADVFQVGLDFVKFVYDRWKSDAIALGSLNLQGAGSAVIVPALPKDVLSALDPYVKRRL
jgi:hypothetical protein